MRLTGERCKSSGRRHEYTGQQLANCLGVAEFQGRVVVLTQRIVRPGVTEFHAAFDEEHMLGPAHFQDRHAIDKTGSIGAGGWGCTNSIFDL